MLKSKVNFSGFRVFQHPNTKSGSCMMRFRVQECEEPLRLHSFPTAPAPGRKGAFLKTQFDPKPRKQNPKIHQALPVTPINYSLIVITP